MQLIDGKYRNIVDIKEFQKGSEIPGIRFSVSGRNIRSDIDVYCYVKIFYIYTDINKIESVFGNAVFPSLLYGGRVYQVNNSLTSLHLSQLKDLGIGFSINLTNHFFDERAYEQSRSFLEMHHRKGNSITCYSDKLAARVRKDFLDYILRASIIKNINTIEKVRKAFDLYDQVVIPMDKNDDDGFLEKLPHKSRILLFGNAGCAYSCKARSCYYGFSQTNQGKTSTLDCSKQQLPRLDLGRIYFDIKKFYEMGFSHFKLIPSVNNATAKQFASDLTIMRRPPFKALIKKPVYYICSFPFSGRTWLRFILCHYINLKFNLNINVNFHSIFTLIPNNGYDGNKGIEIYDYFSDNRFPLILSSHVNYAPSKFSDGKVIFMLRSVYDIIVSDYFQSRGLSRIWDGDIKSFIQSEKSVVYEICRYLNTWAAFLQTGKAHIISYEMLSDDTESTVSGVLEFLGIPISKQLLREAIESSCFSEMKKLEEAEGFPEINTQLRNIRPVKVREGRSGSYKKHLDSNNVDLIKDVCNKELTIDAKKLLNWSLLNNHVGR